ncbi:MAG: PTS sugar transporter subunit IIA [bacterium]
MIKTMALGTLLTDDVIFLDMNAADRMDVIRQVADNLKDNEAVINVDRLVEDAVKREEELPTGLEHGIAMPHARTNAVRHILCAYVRLVEPLDFQAPDGKLCDLVFFSAVPPEGLDSYLHITAALVRKLSREDIREALRQAENSEQVIELLAGNH